MIKNEGSAQAYELPPSGGTIICEYDPFQSWSGYGIWVGLDSLHPFDGVYYAHDWDNYVSNNIRIYHDDTYSPWQTIFPAITGPGEYSPFKINDQAYDVDARDGEITAQNAKVVLVKLQVVLVGLKYMRPLALLLPLKL